MKRFSHRCVALLVAVGLTAPLSVYATNGYFAIGYGMKQLGMGGASVANPEDAMAAGSNPAGMAFVGTRIDVGGQLFNPPRSAIGEGQSEFGFQTPNKSSPAGYTESGSNLFLIPNMGGNFQFNRKISVGMSVIGNGANTRYPTNFFALTGTNVKTTDTLGVQLMQMQMLPTGTYKLTRTQAVGVSPIIAIQTFRAYGLGNFGEDPLLVSSDPSHLTNRGNSWSYGGGLRLGYLGNFFGGQLSLGAMASSRVYMTRFDQYKGLFAQNGSFDIPPILAVGIAIRPDDQWTVAFDVQQIYYHQIKSVGNRHPTSDFKDPCTIPNTPQTCTTPGNTQTPLSDALGGPEGWGFGWNNQTAYKLGVSYKMNESWTLRTGFDYGKSPIPDDQLLFNLLAPAVTEQHGTVGFTYALTPASEINFSWVHAFEHTQECNVGAGCKTMLTQSTHPAPGGGTNWDYVAVKMSYDAVGLGYSLKF